MACAASRTDEDVDAAAARAAAGRRRSLADFRRKARPGAAWRIRAGAGGGSAGPIPGQAARGRCRRTRPNGLLLAQLYVMADDFINDETQRFHGEVSVEMSIQRQLP